MLRSEKTYPMSGLDLAGSLQDAWEKGWLDEYFDNHFLIHALEKHLDQYPRMWITSALQNIYPIKKDNFQENFCVNLSNKLHRLNTLFGEENIKSFITDQLSAGKENYDETQFFRALSEVSVLSYYGLKANSGEYEPRTNGTKNPEARLYCKNGVTVDVEVKTPGFSSFEGIADVVIPTVLLDDEGRKEFMAFCKNHDLNGAMPRVMKIKDFLNSAADKFEDVNHKDHMNLLYINWTLSEFEESGYQEAFSLMANQINGILTHKDIGLSLGIKDDVYDKITAVIVYTESLHGLMFGDFRYVFVPGHYGVPQYGIIGMHGCDGLFEITGMNPYAEQLTPILTGIFRDTKYVPDLMSLIDKHMLRKTN